MSLTINLEDCRVCQQAYLPTRVIDKPLNRGEQYSVGTTKQV